MTHEQIKDDLILFAAGALDGADLAEMQEHLPTCAACRAEVESLKADFSTIRRAAATTPAPAAARVRLLRGVRDKNAGQNAPIWSAPKWVLVPLAASLLFAIGLMLVARENRELRAELTGVKDQFVYMKQERAQAEGILEALRSPEAFRVTLSPAAAPSSQPRVDAVYAPRSGRLVVIASQLAPLTDDKTYQLWLLPKTGAPIPAGIFRPDPSGHAVYTLATLETGTPPTGFAVTIEPKLGSATPTMPIVLVGKVG